MEAIAESSGLNICSTSLENSLQGREVSPSKKRQVLDHDLLETDAKPSKKLKCTEPDELYGVSNFMYLSPKARFFKVSRKDLRKFAKESYGRVPSDSEYEWNTETNLGSKTGSLHGVPVICKRVFWFTVYICMELQGQPGVPTLLGYETIQNQYHIVRRQCSQDLPKSLTVKQMAKQLLEALHNIHRQGIVNAYLDSQTIEWDGDALVIPYWQHCLFRGDCNDFNYSDGYDSAQPIRDLKCAGEIIKKWAMERDCFEQFEELVSALTNPNAFQRVTARQALDMLCGKPIQRPNYLENNSIFVQHSYQQVKAQFVAQFKTELTTAPNDVSKFDMCQWHTEASKNRLTALKFGTRLGQKVFAKIRCGSKKLIVMEYYVTKMMSGASKHFPTVLASSAVWTNPPEDLPSENLKHGFILVMPEYNTEPKEKNLWKTFAELLSALKTLQRYGLVHGDIAPQNIMWNDSDDLILIDFGSVFMANHEFTGPEPVRGGHHGYMAPEWVPNFASDIYSVATVMLYFMNQWQLKDDKMIEHLKKMIHSSWYTRPTLDQLGLEIDIA